MSRFSDDKPASIQHACTGPAVFQRDPLFFSLTSGFKYAERPGSKKPCRIGKGHFPPYGRARHPAPHASILALRFRSPDGTNVLATHVSQRRSGSQSSFKIRCPVLTHRPGPTPRQASHLFRPPTSSSFPPDFSILHPELNPAGLHAGQAFRTVFIDSLPARFDTTWLCHDLDLTRLGFGTTRIATALTSSSPRPSLARIGFHRSPPAGTIRLAGLSAFSVLVPSSAMSRTSAFHGNGSLRPTSSVCAGGTWLRCSACPPRTPPIPWGGIP